MSKFGKAKEDAREMFNAIARDGLSVCTDAAIFKRWLDDAEVNAQNSYLAHKNPAWEGIGPAMDVESGQPWLEPHEAELLAEKLEYEKNLQHLDSWFPTRKRLWLESYARDATSYQRAMEQRRNALIDIYLSDQWRIHGGPTSNSAREELRDLLIPIVIKAFGSVESSLNVLLKESPCSNGHRITTLIHAYELYFLRRMREAVEVHDATAEQRFADYKRRFGDLANYETTKVGSAAGDDEKIRAMLRTDVCRIPAPDEPRLPDEREVGTLQPRSAGSDIRPGAPLSENLPEEDARHDALVPFFEVMERFELLAQEYPDLSVRWLAEDGEWLSWPPPARAIAGVEGYPSSPGSDLHIQTSAGEAGRRLLGTPESWFNPGRDPWLDVEEKEPWERWFYAIREFWLNAGEDAEDASTDPGAFERAAEAVGYLATHNAQAVGERVWRKMVKSKKALRNVLPELGLSAGNTVGKYEQPAGWVQRGCIKHVFKASGYFCEVLAARRACELEKVAVAPHVNIPTEDVDPERRIEPTGTPTGRRIFAPDVVPSGPLPEMRYSLCDGILGDQKKQVLVSEFRNLALEAGMLIGSAMPDAIDNWITRLRNKSLDPNESLVRKLLTGSIDHLGELRLHHISVDDWEKADRCESLAARFGNLHAKFFTEEESFCAVVGTSETDRRKVEREQRLTVAQKRWQSASNRQIPFSWIHRAAAVDHKEAVQWRNGQLSDVSAMAKRIEEILDRPSAPKPPKPQN